MKNEEKVAYKQKVRRVTVDFSVEQWELLFAESKRRLVPVSVIIRERVAKNDY